MGYDRRMRVASPVLLALWLAGRWVGRRVLVGAERVGVSGAGGMTLGRRSWLVALCAVAAQMACERRASQVDTPSCQRTIDALCLIARIPGTTPGGELGFRFGPPLDANGDGVADIAAGARFTRFDTDPSNQLGVASVWSGTRSDHLLHWQGTVPHGLFGHAAVLVPDLDGDGLADLVAVAPTGSRSRSGTVGIMWARSVKTGKMLWTRSGDPGDSLGWDLAPTHDHDGDGVRDLFVGAPSARVGRVHLVSGKDGTIVRTYVGPGERDSFGWYVSTVADLDGDRRDDLLVGAPMHVVEGRPESGAAFAVSSTTGEVLHQWSGAHAQALLGEIVCGLPDLDGDGVAEIAISATYTRAQAGVLAGEVQVFSGATDRRVHRFTGRQERELYGRMVARAGDYDGDGIEDLAIGAPWHRAEGMERAGRMELRSGRTGQVLVELVGDRPQRWLGWHMAPARDLGRGREPGLVISLLRSQEDGVVGAGALELYAYRRPR